MTSRDEKGRFTKAPAKQLGVETNPEINAKLDADLAAIAEAERRAYSDPSFLRPIGGFPDSSTERPEVWTDVPDDAPSYQDAYDVEPLVDWERELLAKDDWKAAGQRAQEALALVKAASEGANPQVKPRFRRWSWRKRR